jgi:hypothetical protein
MPSDASPRFVKSPKLSDKELFVEYAPGVAYVDVEDSQTGERHIGTAFHIGASIYVTAAHVVRDKIIRSMATTMTTTRRGDDGWRHPCYLPTEATHFEVFPHPDSRVDVAFITTDLRAAHLRLGLHTDDLVTGGRLVLEPIIVMGYPPVPQSPAPVLLCTRGEINGCFTPYVGAPRPHLVISPIARGGFSGGPAILADTGECVGVVTQSFTRDGQAVEQGFFCVLAVEAVVETLRAYGRVPDEQKGWTELYELLDYARALRDTPKSERSPVFIVSAWDGIRTTCAFDVCGTREEALTSAEKLAQQHEGGPWTVFRVFDNREDEPIEHVHVKNAKPRAAARSTMG